MNLTADGKPERKESRLNTYEGMFIFLDALKDEELEAAVKGVREEIEKLGGAVENTARMGRRLFARLQGKRHKAGHYIVMNFSLPPDQVTPLRARLKLNETVFRVQIIAVEAPPPVDEPVAVEA